MSNHAISSLDLKLNTPNDNAGEWDPEYQFKVAYTLNKATKSGSNIKFISRDSAEGKEIHNILVQTKSSDETHPHKPAGVVKKVRKQSGKKFSMNDHSKAWKKYKSRPLTTANDKSSTKKDYCVYHKAHKDYTYSDAWIDLLVNELKQV